MSEHSKGPELRYDAEKGEIRRGRELMADVYLPCGPYGPALAERDALGRKMAAAPELVEWLDDAREWMRRNPPTDSMGGVDPDEERERQRLLELGARLLKKAGVEP